MAGEGLAGKARREWVGGGGLWPCGLKKISTRTRAPRRVRLTKAHSRAPKKIPGPNLFAILVTNGSSKPRRSKLVACHWKPLRPRQKAWAAVHAQ